MSCADASPDEEQRLLQDAEREPSTPRKHEPEESLSITQVFRHPDYRKAAIAVIMVMLAQQLSGTWPTARAGRCTDNP